MNKLPNESGRLGEQFASEMLKEKGYDVICTNYHSRYGEIDIICSDEKYIVFVEVKTRSNKYNVLPREYVTSKKQQKIIKTALLYLAENNVKLQSRFDVIEVITGQNDSIISYNHIENAFMLW